MKISKNRLADGWCCTRAIRAPCGANDDNYEGDEDDDDDDDNNENYGGTLQPAQQCDGGRRARNHQLRFVGSPGGIDPWIIYR